MGVLRAVCTRAQVQRLKEPQLSIRGDEGQDLSLLRRFGQGLSHSANRLVSQGVTLQERSAQGCKRANRRPIVP